MRLYRRILHTKKTIPSDEGAENFRNWPGRLRNVVGYSPRELAEEAGIWHIMLVHYEKHEGYLSSRIVPLLANTERTLRCAIGDKNSQDKRRRA